jgi:mRNA interferase MazF
MNPHPGEIWPADLGLAAKTRPVVIVSPEDPDAPRALAICVPLTTQSRNSPYEVQIPKLGFLNAISVANVQGIASIPAIRLERKLGKLPDETMSEIRRALSFALDLRNPAR